MSLFNKTTSTMFESYDNDLCIPDDYETDEQADSLIDRALQIEIDLSHHNGNAPAYKLSSLARSVATGEITYQQAVERLTNKRIITKKASWNL